MAATGCFLILALLAVRPAVAQTALNTNDSNLPRHVTILNGKGQIWTTLTYAYDSYEYYRVGNGGSIRSDNPRFYVLNGPAHWTLQGTGHGYDVVNGAGGVSYHVSKWFKQGDAGVAGTAAGIGGDWKVTDARNKPMYYIESVEDGYTVLDATMHIVTIVNPTEHGYVITNRANKVLWTVKGAGPSGALACAFWSMPKADPWARLLMGVYFFPDWW